SACAALGRNILDDAELVWGIFVRDREHAFTAGREREAGLGIECVSIDTFPMGRVAITFPLSASTTAISLLSQPANRRRLLRSIANPLGSSQGFSGHVDFTSSLLGSIAVSS